MDTQVPLISLRTTGPLGIAHLPRQWLKMRLAGKDRLAEGYRAGGGWVRRNAAGGPRHQLGERCLIRARIAAELCDLRGVGQGERGARQPDPRGYRTDQQPNPLDIQARAMAVGDA